MLNSGGFILVVLYLASVYCQIFLLPDVSLASEKWQGIDESVVEKYAKEHGREPHDPMIDTDQGDLLLFVFLLAGAAGGFAAGYFWRKLTERKDHAPGEVAGRDRVAGKN